MSTSKCSGAFVVKDGITSRPRPVFDGVTTFDEVLIPPRPEVLIPPRPPVAVSDPAPPPRPRPVTLPARVLSNQD